MKSPRFYSRVSLIVASVPGDGMQVEVFAGSVGESPLASGFTPFVATFRAKAEGQICVVLHADGEPVEIPLEELERAIKFARQEVHSETSYPDPEPSSDEQ